MQLIGGNIFTVFLVFNTLSQTSSAHPLHDTHGPGVGGEGEWKRAVSLQPIQLRSPLPEPIPSGNDIEQGHGQIQAAVCSAQSTRNTRKACFCVAVGAVVATAATCAAVLATHHVRDLIDCQTKDYY